MYRHRPTNVQPSYSGTDSQMFLSARTTRRLSLKNMLATTSHHRLTFEIIITILYR